MKRNLHVYVIVLHSEKRNPISEQEQKVCLEVVEYYIANYPLGDIYEGFAVYDFHTASEENVIFEGATKLPIDGSEEHFVKVYNYWTDCLQKIIERLPDAQWYIHIDDVDVTPYFDYPESTMDTGAK